MGELKIDWDLVHKAKGELIQKVWHDPDSELWYLVELINSLQGIAVSAGKWKFPDRSVRVRKSDLSGPESPELGDLCWDIDRAIGMEWNGQEWSDMPYYSWVKRHRKGEFDVPR